MADYWHSVRLDADKCKGCTNCIKMCPTQAIRVQGGKAKILKERCIDCGECIIVCPYHAKKAVTDSFENLSNYKYNVALVAPAFLGQFSKADSIDMILTALKKIGFDDVYEVSRAAEEVSRETRRLLAEGKLKKPIISSACPAVVRLITVKFPNLIENIIPLRSPMEIAAENAKREAIEKTGLKKEEIGVFFISPCAAKATSVKAAITVDASSVDGVISIKDTYLKMAHQLGKMTDIEKLSKAGSEGIIWAVSGGEAKGSGAESRISVDSIHNVLKILEDIDDDKLPDIEYIEALSCTGGCTGGPLTVENPFVCASRIERLCKGVPENGDIRKKADDIAWDKAPKYRPVMGLDEDMQKAIEKAQQIEVLASSLPGLDCGSCGSPSCRALAEDIVRGFAQETDCIFKLRERVKNLAEEMMELEGAMPPSISKEKDDKNES